MKSIEEINVKELKSVVKELNDSGLIKQKIKIVGAKTDDILKNFSEAVEALPEDTDIPASIATFYNDLYADEIADEDAEAEDADGDEIEEPDSDEVEDDESDESDEEQDGDEPDDDQDDSDGEDDESDDDDQDEDADDDSADSDEDETDDGEGTDDDDQDDTPPPVEEKKASKKEPKPPKKDLVIKEEKKPKLFTEKRASVNSKLSLKDKVKNILNFSGGKYKQTTYFILDCETIRVLESNVGLYPSEVFDAMKQDKKAAKKVEKYSNEIAIREINKIKSAYSYIVGAIKEEKADSKFRHIMQALVAGKDVPAEVAHPSTVKVARRALLAYMDVTGVDYSTLKDVRKELVVASSKAEKAEKAPKAEKAEKKPVEVKEEKKAPKADKKSSKK